MNWKRDVTLADLVPRRRRAEAAPVEPLMRAFDLLPREHAGRSARRSPVGAVAVVALAVIAFGAVGTLYTSASAKATDRAARVDELRVRLASLEPVPPAQTAEPALAAEKDARTAALGGALAGRTAWDRVLREISLVLPENVWFSAVQGTSTPPSADPAAPAAPSSVTIDGYALEQAAVAHTLARLGVVPDLGSVRLLSSVATELGGKPVVEFSISASVRS